jgi:hypothetical protein
MQTIYPDYISQQILDFFDFVPYEGGIKIKQFLWKDHHIDQIFDVYSYQKKQMYINKNEAVPDIRQKIKDELANHIYMGAALIDCISYKFSEQLERKPPIPILTDTLYLFSLKWDKELRINKMLLSFESPGFDHDSWNQFGYPDIKIPFFYFEYK